MQEPTITAPETGRDPIESHSEETHAPFTPSESWIKQYQKQATAKLIAGLNQFARTRALAVADAGRKVDDYYARELVLDALGDTWLGVVRWDPDKCSLAYHVVRTIEGRSDTPRRMEELDEVADDAHLDSGQQTEEKLGSVNYIVLLCPGCRATRTLRKRQWAPQYQPCPSCKYKTVRSSTTTVSHSTYTAKGEVEVTDTCSHCDYVDRHRYETPRLFGSVLPALSGGSSSSSDSSSWLDSDTSSSWSSSDSSSDSSGSGSSSGFSGGDSHGGGAGSSW